MVKAITKYPVQIWSRVERLNLSRAQDHRWVARKAGCVVSISKECLAPAITDKMCSCQQGRMVHAERLLALPKCPLVCENVVFCWHHVMTLTLHNKLFFFFATVSCFQMLAFRNWLCPASRAYWFPWICRFDLFKWQACSMMQVQELR